MTDNIKPSTGFGSVVDRTLAVTHVFDAPRELVFRAFTDPDLMARWFAPEPLTVPRSEIDLRVGGRYTFVMRDPDGTDYTSTGTYLEIVEPERIVYTDSVEEMPSSWVAEVNKVRGEPVETPIPDSIVTVTFADVGGRTKVTFSNEFDSRATRDAFVRMQMLEGLEGSLHNLEKVLATEFLMAS